MSVLQPVRGTHDLYFAQVLRHQKVVKTAQQISALYGFSEIKTPIFEFSQVFGRTLGDASDIVSKEMYTFTDKGGEILSLRPEGTAGIMRAYLSEGLAQHQPVKFFYEGPMFRYERPQKGRYRQFYQIGVELIGPESNDADIEVISLAFHLLHALGVAEKVQLEVNSIGDKESRDQYRKILVDYYKNYEKELSADSQRRLTQNPLRILDSKAEPDVKINSGAPLLTDHLNSASKEKFDKILSALTDLKISYKVDPKLVRGLDYYSHMVFEFRTQALGAQDAVLSGGRYDGLAEMMGGPATPAVGWAAGVERLGMLLAEDPKKIRPLTLIPLGAAAENYCRALAHELRGAGFPIDVAYGGNMSNRMKKATNQNAIAALIIGDNELSSGEFSLKILDQGVQKKVQKSDLNTELRKLFCQ
jgi:histidyl-tRNA synthetase